MGGAWLSPQMPGYWSMFCITSSRCIALPCPGCSAPPQSPGRKSRHNSHTLRRAGNEVLRGEEEAASLVWFCTSTTSTTTIVHVGYFRDLHKAVYNQGDLDCLGESRTDPVGRGAWQGGECSYTPPPPHTHTSARKLLTAIHPPCKGTIGTLADWQADMYCISGESKGREQVH